MDEKIPDIKKFETSIIACESCGKDIEFQDKTPLEIINCPYCSGMNFIPMKIDGLWLYKPLGGGGMGAVYKAISVQDGTECAVKILPRDKKSDPSYVKNLMRETEAAAAFGSHPNLAKLINSGFENDEYFLAFEFIKGDRLDIHVSSNHQLTERESLKIINQVLDVEKHMTARGYLYRDLKPENIIIMKDGKVKLIDYGLCLKTDPSGFVSATSDTLEGSPFYLPPERIVGATEGPYSEIYSMGMLLFYMLSGRTYYSQADVEKLVTKHLTAIRVVSVAPHLSNCSRKLVETMDMMIQRNPNNRFHDYQSLEIALKEGYTVLEIERPASKESDLPGERMDISDLPEAGSDKMKSIKTIAAIAVMVIALCIVVFKGFRMYSAMQVKKQLSAEAAAALGVSPDIKAPSKPLWKLEGMVNARAEELGAPDISSIQDFDEESETERICDLLKIEKSDMKEPSKPLEELEQSVDSEISNLIEKEIQEKVKPFNETETREKIAAEMGMKLPFEKPSVSLDQLDGQFKEYIKKEVGERFSFKVLAKKLKEINDELGGFEVGDTVKLVLPTGRTLEGKFMYDRGDKLIIGDTEVVKRDLSPRELAKFNPGICARNVAEATKRAKEEFHKVKNEFIQNAEKEEGEKFYASKGYFKDPSGAWRSADEILDMKFQEIKKKYEDQAAKQKSEITEAVKKNFDKNKHYVDNGYVFIDGKWVSQKEAVAKELAKASKKFADAKNARIREIKSRSLDTAKQEIYKAEGYILYMNQWRAATEVIEEIVQEKIEAAAQDR